MSHPAFSLGEGPQIVALDSISSASVSTASSSDSAEGASPQPPPQQHNWEKFDDEDSGPLPSTSSQPPPLPPPRSELEQLYSTVNKMPTQQRSKQSSPPLVQFSVGSPSSAQTTSTNPFAAGDTSNPFEPSGSRPKSPFEDFSSSIAEALISNSEQKDKDSMSATTLATAGKELFETIKEEEDEQSNSVLESLDSQVSVSATPVLMPSSSASLSLSDASSLSQHSASASGLLQNPSSSGSSTHDVRTAQSRASSSSAIHSLRQFPNAASKNSVLRPIPQEGTFSRETILSNTNPFYSGSVNAGHYPALIPLSQKPSGPRSPSYRQSFPVPGPSRQTRQVNSHSPSTSRRQGGPPPKPQPYSGECQWNQRPANSSNGVVQRQPSTTFSPQRLPSIGSFDPFGDLLANEGGMTGYVMHNNNAS